MKKYDLILAVLYILPEIIYLKNVKFAEKQNITFMKFFEAKGIRN